MLPPTGIRTLADAVIVDPICADLISQVASFRGMGNNCNSNRIFGPQASTLEIYDVQTKDVIGSNHVFSLCFINLQCPKMSEGSACKVMTDMAPLKCQKKKIEELCAKLQTELGRERMALELQEEKKAQAKSEQWLD
ncbi:unnamed protein product [Sphagnum compactum]